MNGTVKLLLSGAMKMQGFFVTAWKPKGCGGTKEIHTVKRPLADSSMYSMLRNKQIPLIYLLLTTAALAVFWQTGRCDFISYDDPKYVTENIHIRHDITMEAIRWAFTTGYASNWHPLTWMSHMLDVQLFGLDPHRHHLINLLFHIVNTLLLFFVFHRMTKAPWKSAFVAALFALHPLHVESVAWVAERKDVLSTFFWMLTMAAYISYVEDRTEDARRRTEDRRQRIEDGEKWTGILRPPSSVLRPPLFGRSNIFCPGPYGQTHAGNPSFCLAAFGFLAPAETAGSGKQAAGSEERNAKSQIGAETALR
ncbi:MAG: hypothetical protein ACLQVJ_11260 [Syntrophobacteraceae bacterium]